jgi:cellulose synthase/poly-beta-1,6-N-acetylglucosamine synthase-like glycosyltransferase
MMVLETLIGITVTILLIPVIVLLVQVLAAPQSYRDFGLHVSAERRSVAILIPAHNEGPNIADSIRNIASQLVKGDRIVVVADNCSDDTAKVASEAGATVVERFDAEHRGKGYALDFGVRHLRAAPPEIVIVIDADCEVAAGAVDELAVVCEHTGRPVQGLYLMRADAQAGFMMLIAEFAWLVRNKVRPLGYCRLGLSCQLMGSGMAFPWHVISAASLATGHIVEDLLLGLHLAASGTPPLFCPRALVTSSFPAAPDGVANQRTRWEHGHLGILTGQARVLLWQAIVQRNLQLVALLLDLCVPPLALLTLLVTTVFATTAILFAYTRMVLPFYLSTASLLLLMLAVLLAWSRHGKQVISLASLAMAPIYALSKIPLYLKFVVDRQVEWVRSKRGRD